MKKVELIQHLHQMISDMSFYIEKLPKKIKKFITDELADENYHEVQKFHAFIKHIHAEQYQIVRAARELVPENMWNMYAALGTEGLQEQRIYSEALNKFKTAFQERYAAHAEVSEKHSG